MDDFRTLFFENSLQDQECFESRYLMIQSKQDLKEYIAVDNAFMRPNGIKATFTAEYTYFPNQLIRKFLYYLRKQEYYINTAKGNKLKSLLGLYYERKKNRLGILLGIEIGPNCFGKGLSIWHAGNIVVNADARIGEFCTLHGGNCIGNNGKDKTVPHIGSYVDIGFGAIIIGDVKIADGCKIGANSVVNKSVLVKDSVIVGIPGKPVLK